MRNKFRYSKSPLQFLLNHTTDVTFFSQTFSQNYIESKRSETVRVDQGLVGCHEGLEGTGQRPTKPDRIWLKPVWIWTWTSEIPKKTGMVPCGKGKEPANIGKNSQKPFLSLKNQ